MSFFIYNEMYPHYYNSLRQVFMKITIITLFPKMIEGFFNESIIKKAQEKGLVKIELVDLRKYAIDNHGTVDDRPYGGGAGMVMRIEPIYEALKAVMPHTTKSDTKHPFSNPHSRIIMTQAQGKTYNQRIAESYSKLKHIVIVVGHYEGIDERVNDYVDDEISIGDFVLTGGEIVASLIVDSVVRLIPGVLKKDDAILNESFFEVSVERIIKCYGIDEPLRFLKRKGIKKVTLLEYPHYTRPTDFMDKKVPDVLMSGNHEEIEKWRICQAYERTVKRRPDLLTKKL